MKQSDSELVKQTLAGDQQAFALLVEKYQEQIHTLAWQKIGDFHTAEEITQDAFITAYQKLNSLKHPHRFSGWLYVITTNICNMWHRKKKPQLESLEQTDPMELEEVYYTEYKTQEREEERKENQRSVVRKLLSRLKESDRTVVTLHYLAGLSCEEIGEFLGVSTNTVKIRLHRARNRLKGEEALIQENLGSFQLPKQLSENIMQEISNLSPAAPSASKPVMPWIVSSASAIIVFLLIGVGAKQLIHFQKPFSIDAASERTIEITDARQVIDSAEKPTVRNQVGRVNNPNTKNEIAQNTDVSDVNPHQTNSTKKAIQNNLLDKGKTSLSGVVVGTNGEVVRGLELYIKPIEFNQRNEVVPRIPLSNWTRAITDTQGGFSFSNIDAVSSQLVILPEATPEYEIASIKVRDLTYYPPIPHPNLGYWFGKPTISIEPDIPLEDTVVTVKPSPMQIRGRILLKDKTPLANAQFRLTARYRDRDTFLYFFTESESGGGSSRDAKTDSQGYFVAFYRAWETEYYVSTEYKGETVKSRWFKVKPGQQNDVHIFRLKHTETFQNNMRKRINARQAIWSVNPENGHAYKRIQCESWHDAKLKAAAENAYLVAVSNEGEQRWLEGRFAENKFYWIGLSSTQDGASWQWENGESLTYTNWLEDIDSNHPPNIPVAMDFFSKRWMAIGKDSHFKSSIKHAIIERED